MFKPPRCPHPDCPYHRQPIDGFYRSFGSYHPKCRERPVPRFLCKGCRRTFSRQTFRADYCDNKPFKNTQLVELLCAGVGFRQSARMLGIHITTALLKFRKLARHAQDLDWNLMRDRSDRADPLELHFDEFETFETHRTLRPLTMAMAIETHTRFIFGARSAPIRPKGKMTPKRLEAIALEEELFGKRPSRSKPVVRWAFKRAARCLPNSKEIRLFSDEKSTYGGLCLAAFGEVKLYHDRTSSLLPRGKKNPLFPINHMEACARDWIGRLRRESWLVSKYRWFLNLHLRLYSAWRNWVRPRFNRDEASPGMLMGFVHKRLRPHQLLGWRQDWGLQSPHPLHDGSVDHGAERQRARVRQKRRAAADADSEQLATFMVPVF